MRGRRENRQCLPNKHPIPKSARAGLTWSFRRMEEVYSQCGSCWRVQILEASTPFDLAIWDNIFKVLCLFHCGNCFWIFEKNCVNIFELYKGYKKLFSSLYNNCPELQGTVKVQKVASIQLLMKKFLPTFKDQTKTFTICLDRKISFVHGKIFKCIFTLMLLYPTLWNVTILCYLHSNHYCMASESCKNISYYHGSTQNCLYRIKHNNLILK